MLGLQALRPRTCRRHFANTFVWASAVGFVLALGGEAEAQRVTFDELTPTANPILGSVVCADGAGFRFLSDHFHLIGGVLVSDFSSSGTTHIGYESGRGFPITMERVGGGTFSLVSLDAAEFYAVPVNDRPDAQTLTITGFQQGGGTVSHTVTIDGLRDGPGGLDDFEHFVLPSTFVDLTSVVFTGLRAGDLSGGVALDNIEYQLPVPEVLAACVAIPLPTDTPTVTITSPVAGTVAGTVMVDATATDNVGVVSVQFAVDGVYLGAAAVTVPYAVAWDSTTVADGLHTLTAHARDAAGNVGTASVVVAVVNTPSTRAPSYLDFDGVDDYLEVADAADLSFGNGTADTPLTFEAWLRPDSLVRHQLISKWDGVNTEYKLHLASGTIRLDLRDSSAQASVYAYTTASQVALIGGWHHLAVTYDGRGGPTAANGITIYLDGVAVPLTRGNHPAYVAMENLTAPVQIGRESAGWKQFDGALDELRLWRVARAPADLRATMTTALSGAEPGLVAYWPFNDGIGAALVDDAPAHHVAVLYNGTAWMPGGPMGTAAPDVTAPTITNIVTTNLTESGFTVAFSTSEVATAWVSYSAGVACPCTDVYSATIGTTHVITVTGLAPDTVYQFVVKATDGAGNLQVASPLSVRTWLPAPEGVPPAVVMVHPVAGTVAGTVMVDATATDNVGVVSVQFAVDGVYLGAAAVTVPYAVAWDSTTVADGLHTLTAHARDAAGNVGTASVVVAVVNTPSTRAPYYLDFDGVDDYLEVADAADLSFGNGTADTPLTFEAWLRPDSLVRHQLISKWDGVNTEYKLHLASGTIRLDLRDSSAQASVYAYTTASQVALIGGWHHLAVTYDGRGGPTAANGITIYLDGVAVPLTRGNHPAYVAMENLTAPVQIGRESAGWKQFDGALDELRLWRVARTPADLRATMTTALSGAEPGLVAYWPFNDGTGAALVDDAPAHHVAVLYNGTAWMPGGPMGTAAPDVTAPTITNIVTTNLTESGFTVAFSTSEVATAWVWYSAGVACPCTDVYSATIGTTHVITVTGLAPDTVYQFVVKATDGAGNLQVASPLSVRTWLPAPEGVPPAVVMVHPVAGTVAGTVMVDATATDNVGVVSVQFAVDGVYLGAAAVTVPYAVAWDSTTVADGLHTLTAHARDAAGNVGTASVVVTVVNTPGTRAPYYLDFDGVDDYLEVADAADLSFGNGTADTPLTFEAWLRPDSLVRHQLISKWDGVNTEYKLHLASGTIRLDLRDSSAQASVYAYTTASQVALIGGWHHLAVTYDGRGGPTAANGITIYLDGVAVPLTRGNHPAYVAMENLTAPVQIGRESAGWKQFDGALDELRLWRVARTPADLRATMTTALSGAEPGLVAYWPFNDGTGAALVDDAPAHHVAVLYNGTAWMPGGAPIR